MSVQPLRLGISRCLLGDEVRFDGGHKRDPFLIEVFSRYVEWVPVCPEVEAGLGTPREAMQLTGDPSTPRLITIKSRMDHTPAVERAAAHRLRQLRQLDLSGYVFKKDSPSCGLERVRIYHRDGTPRRHGVGIFARAFRREFPLAPVEEEGRLRDPVLRENFIERVFAYRRYQDLLRDDRTKPALVRFHTIHKFLLLSHSRPHYEALGRLVGEAHRYRPKELAETYGALFMSALAEKATVRKHVNVLNHIVGFFRSKLTAQEKRELLGVIEDFRH
ncbi:MAG TPA: DUF523 and DUF1722 domain-containing protein, partial [Nitrospira sp.]|nr:DUF523 and DUF1722 domain-containing protein [Nitrospira sp.]